MPENIRSIVRIFADDTIAYLTTCITSGVDRIQLQDDHHKLAILREKKLKTSFYSEKNVMSSFTSKREPTTNEYVLEVHELQHVTEVKYLGLYITSDMKWSGQITTICKN